MDDAKIKPPGIEQIVRYQEAVRQRHPMLQNVWCIMDGINLLLECAVDEEVQNQCYNGWTWDKLRECCFGFWCFVPMGLFQFVVTMCLERYMRARLL